VTAAAGMLADRSVSVSTPGTPTLARAALLLCATVWAASLVVLGSWFWLEGPMTWPVAAVPCRVAGLTLTGAGQLIFLCFVADRVFPHAPRRVVTAIEGLTVGAVLSGSLWLLVAAVELAIGALR